MSKIININQKKTEYLRLHLELSMDVDGEEWETLRKYGKVAQSISRDVLVSAEMPLHNLHYAIQRAFGWQNCHLHEFSYPDEVVSALTGNRVEGWLPLCGVYFRFPDEDDRDIYWDDDYNGYSSFPVWLKKKYTAPYFYGGRSEHFLFAQTAARAFEFENSVIRVAPSFEEFQAGDRKPRTKKLTDVSLHELQTTFDSGMFELLERLPVGQVIGLSVDADWKENVDALSKTAAASMFCSFDRLNRGEDEPYDIFTQANPAVLPLSDTLLYSYDYGDGWEVLITCTGVFDEEACGEYQEQLALIAEKGRPVCIAADGLPVLDDVGGIYGYCAFLNAIHGKDGGDFGFDDKEETKEWARGQGWSGTMKKPESIL